MTGLSVKDALRLNFGISLLLVSMKDSVRGGGGGRSKAGGGGGGGGGGPVATDLDGAVC